MEGNSRPEGMSDVEWLVALEEIQQLKARRDRYADAHDWDAYQSLARAGPRVAQRRPGAVDLLAGDDRQRQPDHGRHDHDPPFLRPRHRLRLAHRGPRHLGDDRRHHRRTKTIGDRWSIGYGYYYESLREARRPLDVHQPPLAQVLRRPARTA